MILHLIAEVATPSPTSGGFNLTQAAFGLIVLVLGGGFVTALIQAFKARPERDSVIITNAQNASEMLRGTNEAIYKDWERERDRRQECERLNERLEAQVDALTADKAQLTASLRTAREHIQQLLEDRR